MRYLNNGCVVIDAPAQESTLPKTGNVAPCNLAKCCISSFVPTRRFLSSYDKEMYNFVSIWLTMRVRIELG